MWGGVTGPLPESLIYIHTHIIITVYTVFTKWLSCTIFRCMWAFIWAYYFLGWPWKLEVYILKIITYTLQMRCHNIAWSRFGQPYNRQLVWNFRVLFHTGFYCDNSDQTAPALSHQIRECLPETTSIATLKLTPWLLWPTYFNYHGIIKWSVACYRHCITLTVPN